MKQKYLFLIFLAGTITGLSLFYQLTGCTETKEPTSQAEKIYGPDSAIFSKIRNFKNILGARALTDKITDNFGEGFDKLYGTRNMRPVLYGIAYRGGANNYYNKKKKRDNRNPLPDEGLKNLAKMGFSKAIYLYTTNFRKARKSYTDPVTGNSIHYYQNSLSNDSLIHDFISKVYESITIDSVGPVYIHCWNGWHQSGYASAILLKQFCNYSNSQAVNYWIKCTDGVNKGYDHIKQAIRNFKPYPEFKISDSMREMICPCLEKDKKAGK